jgi:integrase
MLGKRAKILSDDNIRDLLAFTTMTRYPTRNRIMVLLSLKAGLRAGEIANLTWDMVTHRPRRSDCKEEKWPCHSPSPRVAGTAGDFEKSVWGKWTCD